MRPLIAFCILFSCACVAYAQHYTFYVDKNDSNKLKDPCGHPVRLIGINKMSIFSLEAEKEARYFEEIAKTGSNCVRIVWAARYPIEVNDKKDFLGAPTTDSTLENLIKKCIQHRLIPIIEAHDATGDWSLRERVMNLWERPEIISLIKKYENYIILNIGNEIGGSTGSANESNQEYVIWYKDVVSRMRNKGLQVPLMIDAPEWGKNMTRMSEVGNELLQFDSNLIFSVHTYWSNYDIYNQSMTPAKFIYGQFEKVRGWPMVIGELSKYGGDGDDTLIHCGDNNIVSFDTIAMACNQYGFGYIAWEFGPGNAGGGDTLCYKMDMTSNGTFDSLKTWGLDIVNKPYGIKANAIIPDYFKSDCQCENVVLTITTVSSGNISRLNLKHRYDWKSSSTNISSFILEITKAVPGQSVTVRSEKFTWLPINDSHSKTLGMYETAQLKVIRKGRRAACHVRPVSFQ
ncbi:MAG: cellulase family glycosylhydrolase [Saprospiraceae bacterium]